MRQPRAIREQGFARNRGDDANGKRQTLQTLEQFCVFRKVLAFGQVFVVQPPGERRRAPRRDAHDVRVHNREREPDCLP
tara:strand:- start:3420 stop:3656 length:237 start_codon:yes stop_codon:yes gene_type:complete